MSHCSHVFQSRCVSSQIAMCISQVGTHGIQLQWFSLLYRKMLLFKRWESVSSVLRCEQWELYRGMKHNESKQE